MRWDYEYKTIFSAGGDDCGAAQVAPSHTVLLKARILDRVSQISPYDFFRPSLVHKLADFDQLDDEEQSELNFSEGQRALVQKLMLDPVFCDLLRGRSDAYATHSLEKAFGTNRVSALGSSIKVECEVDWRMRMWETINPRPRDSTA